MVSLRMTASPPDPVYAVMVSVRLLVAKLRWACNAVGSAERTNNDRKVSAVAV